VTIRFSKYVSITSGVGGNAAVRQRDLIGRIFSIAAILSPDAVLEFNAAADVGKYFGIGSEEYARAAFYFSYTAPSLGTPQKISFARYSAAGNGFAVYGSTHAPLAQLELANAGGLVITVAGVARPVAAIDLDGLVSLAAVAAAVTAAIRAAYPALPELSASTVSYDAVNARFVFATNHIAAQTGAITSNAVGVNDLATALGLTAALGAVSVAGVEPQTPVEAFNAANAISNNFGTFVFATTLTIEQHEAVAQANAGLNVAYQYMVPVSRADWPAWEAALDNYQGTGLTLSTIAGRFPEMAPMCMLAATRYDRPGATSVYMFKQFGGLTAEVTTDAESDALDAARVNYYGNTQTAGQVLSFYQRGVLKGPPSAPLDMNTYANEQWLKDHAGAGVMGLLMSVGRVPANDAGRGQIRSQLQDTVDAALNNGVISIGRTFTPAQKVAVTTLTGDPLAWHQVQNAGYWLDVRIVPTVGPGNTTEYKVLYTLIYAKDDAIRSVDGAHILI
jgi:hypothetical protein